MKKVGIILGSGIKLKSFDKYVYKRKDIKSKGIHKKVIKELIYDNKQVIIFQGRSHLYETNDYNQIFSNINYANERNIDFLIITNAAGAINPDFSVSDLMLMTAHINLMGKLLKNWGYFPYYDRNLIDKIYQTAISKSIRIKTGVYCALTGPVYETRKEIKLLRKIGVDSVGMSTIPEIYLASRYGIRTLGISIITNLLKENSNNIVQHNDVLKSAYKASKKLEKLIEIILNIYDN